MCYLKVFFKYSGPPTCEIITNDLANMVENCTKTSIFPNEGVTLTNPQNIVDSNGEIIQININTISSSKYEVCDEPMILLPLSFVKSRLKANIICGVPKQTNVKSTVLPNNMSRDRQETDTSVNVINSPPAPAFQSQLSMAMEKSTTSSSNVSSPTTQRKREKLIKDTNTAIKSSNKQKRKKMRRLKKLNANVFRKRDVPKMSTTSIDAPTSNAETKCVSTSKLCREVTLCRICGDTATEHIHYGGRCCASCRAFFRRSVEKETR